MKYRYKGDISVSGRVYGCVPNGQGKVTAREEDGGTVSWTYKGAFDDGRMTGHGKMTYGEQYPNVADYVVAGCVYEGYHRDGKAHGRGTWYRSDGTKEYVGDFQADEYHGQGTWYRPDGTKEYVGDFQANEYHGQGTSYRPDGTKEYEGEWRASYWQGHGTLFHLDGNHKWKDDWRNGGSQSYEDGSRYEGEWDDDGEQRHGWGILYDPNLNIVYKGLWQNDESQ